MGIVNVRYQKCDNCGKVEELEAATPPVPFVPLTVEVGTRGSEGWEKHVALWCADCWSIKQSATDTFIHTNMGIPEGQHYGNYDFYAAEDARLRGVQY